MALQYACFISFRHHSQSELAERFIRELYEAISNEIDILLGNEKVYIDFERLQAGDFYDDELARCLCQSACMVMVFTPTYFDKEHSFCAREYIAMKSLEERRLNLLNNAPGGYDIQRHGLIIPIVLRGEENLMAEIKNRRHYYNFDSFILGHRKLSKHPKYALEIKKIAKYIAERYLQLRQVSADPCFNCVDFRLPQDAEIKDWLESVTSPILPLPGR